MSLKVKKVFLQDFSKGSGSATDSSTVDSFLEKDTFQFEENLSSQNELDSIKLSYTEKITKLNKDILKKDSCIKTLEIKVEKIDVECKTTKFQLENTEKLYKEENMKLKQEILDKDSSIKSLNNKLKD